LNAKVADFNLQEGKMTVRRSKGKKDRVTILSESYIPLHNRYIRQYKPKSYLFEGIHGGKYSYTSLLNVFNRAKKAAEIHPGATLHSLRHSFATHLIDSGIDSSVVQKLLGHESIKTTQIYLHVSKKAIQGVRSPLDNLEL
jgi:site-specific recombinase XerD